LLGPDGDDDKVVTIQDLPSEIKERILKRVPRTDLDSLVFANRTWRDLIKNQEKYLNQRRPVKLYTKRDRNNFYWAFVEAENKTFKFCYNNEDRTVPIDSEWTHEFVRVLKNSVVSELKKLFLNETWGIVYKVRKHTGLVDFSIPVEKFSLTLKHDVLLGTFYSRYDSFLGKHSS